MREGNFENKIKDKLYDYIPEIEIPEFSHIESPFIINSNQKSYSAKKIYILGESSVNTIYTNTFNGCKNINDIEFINSSVCTNFNHMFNTCYVVKSLDMIDFNNVSTLTAVLGSMSSLYNCTFANISGTGLNVSATTLNRESLLSLLKALQETTTTKTITLGATRKAQLSDEDIAIATDKGWTVA